MLSCKVQVKVIGIHIVQVMLIVESRRRRDVDSGVEEEATTSCRNLKSLCEDALVLGSAPAVMSWG